MLSLCPQNYPYICPYVVHLVIEHMDSSIDIVLTVSDQSQLPPEINTEYEGEIP